MRFLWYNNTVGSVCFLIGNSTVTMKESHGLEDAGCFQMAILHFYNSFLKL
jgi:hypothetical protein